MTNQKTLNKILQGNFFDRGSKFYAFINPVASLEEYKSLIKKYKQNNVNACHVCSAYRIYDIGILFFKEVCLKMDYG